MKLGQNKKDEDNLVFALQKPAPKALEVACADGTLNCAPLPSFRLLENPPNSESSFGGRFCIGEEAFNPDTMVEIGSWDSVEKCESEMEVELGDCCMLDFPFIDGLLDTCYFVSDLESCMNLKETVQYQTTDFVWNSIGKRRWLEVGLETAMMCEERCRGNSSSSSSSIAGYKSSSSSSSIEGYKSSSSSSGFKCPPSPIPICECGLYTEFDEKGCPEFLCRSCSSSTTYRCPEVAVPECDCGHLPILDASNCLSYGCIECPEDPEYPINPGYGAGTTTEPVLVPDDDTLLPRYGSSTTSLFIEIPAVPYYSQTSQFGDPRTIGATIPLTDVRVFTDRATPGGMTNDNRYNSTYSVAQTMCEAPKFIGSEEAITALYLEPIEFTHVRVGPPPCHIYEYTAPYISTSYASGAINGNPNEDFTACDGSFYLGASIQYGLTASGSNWGLVGNTTDRAFLDANKKIVRNEYVGDYTVKIANAVRIADNGNMLAIAEFIPVFISDRMITILTQPDFVSVDNGARFEAKVVAEITYGEMEYKWQVFKLNPTTSILEWMDIFGDVGITGEDTDTIVVTPDIPDTSGIVEYSWNGAKFRCVLTAPKTLTKKSVEVTFNMPNIVYGCTDPASPDYNPNAQVDNGTCREPV